MSLQIIKPGIADSIQHSGRYGYQHLGINPGGAMDPVAMRLANTLVNNPAGEAVLELHFPAATIRFHEDVLLALSGADFAAMINDIPVHINQPYVADKNSVLRFTKKISGARCYLALRGGFSNCQFPYHFSGDQNMVALPWKADLAGLYTKVAIRFVAGPEFPLLTNESRHELLSGNFRITPQSNRMGYRLNSQSLYLQEPLELVSTAVTRGTIQLLPGGQLIILMADHQTTGGYPRIGQVIRADLPSLAQMNAGEVFSLMPVSIAESEDLLVQQERHLQQLQYSCNFRMQEYFPLL